MHDHPAFKDWEQRKITASSGPWYVTICSTGSCNLNCFMCGHGIVKELPVTIEPEHLDSFLEKAERVFLAGGEPFWMTKSVNRNAARIFDSLVKRHRHLRLNANTNGTLLNRRMAKVVLDRFESIHFSIDSLDPAVYKKVRGKPLLKAVLKNIKTLYDLKKEKGLKGSDPPHINMNTIVMRSTVEGVPAIAGKLAEFEGRRHVLLKLNSGLAFDFHDEMAKDPELKGGRAKAKGDITEVEKVVRKRASRVTDEVISPSDLPPERLKAIKEELVQVYRSSGIEPEDQLGLLQNGSLPRPDPSSREAVCQAPWITAEVRPDGKVVCCCYNSVVLGNVISQSFDEIWNGGTAKKIRESFVRGEMFGCNQGGCPAPYDYFTLNKGSYAKDLLTNLQKEFTEPERVRSILLFRTAPQYPSHLAARTLRMAFPKAALTIVTNQDGAGECEGWDLDARVVPFPERYFTNPAFGLWWAGLRHQEEFDLAVAVYNNDGRIGYEQVEKALKSVKAARKIGAKPNGGLVKFF